MLRWPAMLDWIIPQEIETIHSGFNGEIKVKKFLGHTSVWVGGYEQSGPIVQKLWRTALGKLPAVEYEKILVLGLGCGVMVPLLNQKYPRAKITGVEIDPEMIRLGKKYFGLESLFSLKVLCSDAKKFLRQSKTYYDLVVVDLYTGGQAPELSVRDLKKVMKGPAVFNFSAFNKSLKEARQFEKRLRQDFFVFKKIKTDYNLLFFCRPTKPRCGY